MPIDFSDYLKEKQNEPARVSEKGLLSEKEAGKKKSGDILQKIKTFWLVSFHKRTLTADN